MGFKIDDRDTSEQPATWSQIDAASAAMTDDQIVSAYRLALAYIGAGASEFLSGKIARAGFDSAIARQGINAALYE